MRSSYLIAILTFLTFSTSFINSTNLHQFENEFNKFDNHFLNKNVYNDEIISDVLLSNPSFTIGSNDKFKHATIRNIVGLLGRNPTDESYHNLRTVVHDNVSDLPDFYDARDAYPQCSIIKHIQDQSSCGSCWANSAASVMSDRLCIHSNGKIQVLISVEDIMSCCPAFCGRGCNGGWEYQAFRYSKYFGVVSGGDYNDKSTCKPYPFPKCDHHVKGEYGPCPDKDYSTPKCKKECEKESGETYSNDKHFTGDGYKTENDEKQIRAEILKSGPVTAAFSVYEDFPIYKSGVYKHVSGKFLGGHAVRIIGWGIENDTPYWLVANSWNEGWGMNGLFKILRGKNECGIEQDIASALPKLDN